jgi:hypothetical protein
VTSRYRNYVNETAKYTGLLDEIAGNLVKEMKTADDALNEWSEEFEQFDNSEIPVVAMLMRTYRDATMPVIAAAMQMGEDEGSVAYAAWVQSLAEYMFVAGAELVASGMSYTVMWHRHNPECELAPYHKDGA